ncbi:MAG: protein kinase [Sandaracinaceae bacterium]
MSDDAQALAETLAAPPGAIESVRPSEGPPLTGATLDHFEIGERIGRGGMGDVYAARDMSLDRNVAIKVLRPEVTEREGMASRFRREARSQARFNHPNIVHIYYIGRRAMPGGEDALFFAMERIDGGDLESTLRDGEAMDPEEARLAMLQVADGLRAAHRVGVIHRDIKPSNLMRAEDGLLKIADFGLAKPIDQTDASITQEGAMVGSPYYMAPEQALSGEVDHRTDMYALGASFYHLLCGRPPFEGRNSMAVVAKHLSEEPEPLSRIAPHVPPPLAAIVHRLLAKKAEDRFEDYDALRDALEEAAPRRRAVAPITTRMVAATGDFLVACLLIGLLGSWGWVGLLVYMAVVTAGHAWRGQTPAKLLLGIEVCRDDGSRLTWPRSIVRTVGSLWAPLLVGATIAMTSGIPELLETIEGLRPDSLDSLHGVLMAMAISHGFMTLLYLVGIGIALFNDQRKTLHDLAVGSVVTYRLDRAEAPPSSKRAVASRAASSSSRVRSTRPPA